MKSRHLERVKQGIILFFISCVFVLFINGCNKSSSPTTSTSNGPGANEVWMQNTAFSPASITVTVGTKITWTNKDSFAHTVTSGTPGNQTTYFDSGNIPAGSTFSFTFDSAGTFKYFCKIHPTVMQATVTVK